MVFTKGISFWSKDSVTNGSTRSLPMSIWRSLGTKVSRIRLALPNVSFWNEPACIQKRMPAFCCVCAKWNTNRSVKLEKLGDRLHAKECHEGRNQLLADRVPTRACPIRVFLRRHDHECVHHQHRHRSGNRCARYSSHDHLFHPHNGRIDDPRQ